MTKIMAKKYFTQRKRIRELFFFYIIEKEKLLEEYLWIIKFLC